MDLQLQSLLGSLTCMHSILFKIVLLLNCTWEIFAVLWGQIPEAQPEIPLHGVASSVLSPPTGCSRVME